MANHEHNHRFHHFSLERLLSPQQFATYGPTGMGPGTDFVEANGKDNDLHPTGGKTHRCGDQAVCLVREFDFEWFRGRLVEHFDILFKRGEIWWPTRKKQAEPMVGAEHHQE